MPLKKRKATADPRVQQQLEAVEVPFIISDGDVYTIKFEAEEGEDRTVLINSDTQQICGEEWREIWTIVMISEGPLDDDLANMLLIGNAITPIGSWQVIPASPKQFLVGFSARILAECKPEILKEYLFEIVSITDEFMESLE